MLLDFMILLHIAYWCNVLHSIYMLLFVATQVDQCMSVAKSVLGIVHNLWTLVLHLCCEMVVSLRIVDTRQMLYKNRNIILCKLCGHKPMNNTVGYPFVGHL